jgi:kynurenine formamidase
MNLPRYDELPHTEGGGRSAWGLFGEDDSLGLMNLQSPESVQRAARLIQRGEVFPLNAPLDVVDPPMFGRGVARCQTVVDLDGLGIDDRIDELFTHGASHWDALGHIAFGKDRFYNGATLDQVLGQRRNTIDHWARLGIAGRAVLIDVQAHLDAVGGGFDPGSSRAITAAELEATRRACGAVLEPGDIILLHTGFLDWYTDQPPEVRERYADEASMAAVGLAHEEAVVRYLWDNQIRGIASDCPALEVWPPDLSPVAWPFGFLHQMLLGQLGIAIGELWSLSVLARDCRADGRYEVFLTSAPLNMPGGIGSPANAIAIK